MTRSIINLSETCHKKSVIRGRRMIVRNIPGTIAPGAVITAG